MLLESTAVGRPNDASAMDQPEGWIAQQVQHLDRLRWWQLASRLNQTPFGDNATLKRPDIPAMPGIGPRATNWTVPVALAVQPDGPAWTFALNNRDLLLR